MNPDPDYSAAYVRLATDDGPEGDGFVFTIGRGNDVVVDRVPARSSRYSSAVPSARPDDLAGTARALLHDSPAAVAGTGEGRHAHGHRRPWSTPCGTAQSRVPACRCGSTSRSSPPRSSSTGRLPLPQRRPRPGAGAGHPAHRRARPRASGPSTSLEAGYPAYTTSPGGSGTATRRCVRLAREAVADGYTQIKLKVGRRPRGRRTAADARPRGRRAGHPDRHRRQPAVGRRGRDRWVHVLAPFDPYWIEEPTSPGRRARPRGDPRRGRPRQGGHR